MFTLKLKPRSKNVHPVLYNCCFRFRVFRLVRYAFVTSPSGKSKFNSPYFSVMTKYAVALLSYAHFTSHQLKDSTECM